MFASSINANIRSFIAKNASVFNDKQIIIGSSGDFSLEKLILQNSHPTGVFSTADVQYYKGLFLARHIDFCSAEQGFAVLADGKVLGFIEMSRIRHDFINKRIWYLLSDFPIEPKPHELASKLIAMIALSNEMRAELEKTNLLKSVGVITTAWTHRQSSMKYRSYMECIKREVGALTYYADWPNKGMKQFYQEWWSKWASKTPSSANSKVA